MTELKAATDRGVIVFNCSQCYKGSVTAVYQTGHVRNVQHNNIMRIEIALYDVLYSTVTRILEEIENFKCHRSFARIGTDERCET